jgi:branched-chain amino acid transport system substrate-binding protein
MHHVLKKAGIAVLSAAALWTASTSARAEKQYDAGASDIEIKIGNTTAYSGPASAYSVPNKTQAAYFRMVNEKGGINGRKINFLSYDDSFSPPKTVEQTRKLVEGDEVLVMFSMMGTSTALAVQKYLNQKHVPQLFVGSGAGGRWSDYKTFPWSMGFPPSYQDEARAYAKYILQNYPGKTVGVLYQNDDFGKDYLIGLSEVFGESKSKIVTIEAPFNSTDPTVDSQVARIKAANVDIFINVGFAKFAAQAIKKVGEMNWKPIQFLTNISTSVGTVMKPAGLEYAQGIISAAYLKDPTDSDWKDDAGLGEWRAFMAKYYPEGDLTDRNTLYGYGSAKALEQVLRQCGDDLTRENVMRQAANLDFEIGAYLPGVRIKTSPTDFIPIDQFQLMRFKGETWERFGTVISGGDTK